MMQGCATENYKDDLKAISQYKSLVRLTSATTVLFLTKACMRMQAFVLCKIELHIVINAICKIELHIVSACIANVCCILYNKLKQ